MENNWKEIAEEIFKNEFNLDIEPKEGEITLDWNYIWKATEKCMNLVFEATKQECADKAKIKHQEYETSEYTYSENDFEINKESILNINKPNL